MFCKNNRSKVWLLSRIDDWRPRTRLQVSLQQLFGFQRRIHSPQDGLNRNYQDQARVD